MRPPLQPSPLKKGDTLGIIAPAGQMRDIPRFEKGITVLKEMGFKLKFPRDLWPGREYLADSDKNRAKEFNFLFRDDETKGLISLRGGYGCLRMLDKIDLELVAANPKLVVGFSDITILQNYLYQQTGLVSLHGPVVTSLATNSRDSLVNLHLALTGRKPFNTALKEIEVLRDSRDVTGPLIGGNLASMVTLLGTSYDFSWKGAIVFLEDVNEPLYKIDRMLTQLKLAGKFEQLGGLILGDFSSAALTSRGDIATFRETVWARVLELCSEQSIPIWGNFPAGHCDRNHCFPLGAEVTMKVGKRELFF